MKRTAILAQQNFALGNQLAKGLTNIMMVIIVMLATISPVFPVSSQSVYAQATAATFCTDNNVTEIPLAQCEALVAIYESTGGANWTDNTNWLTTNTPCNWSGVSCTGTSSKNVWHLNLGNRNLVGSLPPEIGDLSELQHLYLWNSGLTSIPAEIGNLTKLRTLYLGSNRLVTLPTEIGNLVQLQNLWLDDNQITSLPATMANLSQLQTLSLRENGLTALPTGIENLTQILRLYLDNNQLVNLPNSIGALSQLQTLSLYGNNLTVLPSIIGSLTQLQSLNLAQNNLVVLPSSIGSLTQLRYLNLSSNQLITLPAEIGNLVELQNLSLDNNQINSLPATMANLSELRTLSLQKNGLTALPSIIGSLSQLQYLNLAENELATLPADIFNLTQLRTLHLNANQLTSIPAQIASLTQLQNLNLDNNEISDVTPLSGLTNLQGLSLAHNQISDISALSNLTNLSWHLRLSNNQISDITALSHLTNLGSLDLSNNQIGVITALSNLTNIWSLNLSHNEISDVTPIANAMGQWGTLNLSYNQIGDLSPLSSYPSDVDVSNNQIQTIPAALVNAENLQSLDASFNQLSGSLPAGLGSQANLRTLKLHENPQLTGALPLSLANLTNLNTFYYGNTGLSEPSDATFASWLSAVSDLCSSGICYVYVDVSKTANRDSVNPNEPIEYTITLDGAGHVISSTAVISSPVLLEDFLPSGVTYVENSLNLGQYDSGQHRIFYEPMTLTHSITEPLMIAITYDVVVNADAAPGTLIENVATLYTQDLPPVTVTNTVEVEGITPPSCEVIRDNADTDGSVILAGNWTGSTQIDGYHGSNYLHTRDENATARFMAPGAGESQASIRWTEHGNRATNVTVVVVHANGTDTHTVNQEENGGTWVPLGVYTFDSNSYVEIQAAGANEHVIADAVRFVATHPDCPPRPSAQIYISPPVSEIQPSELYTVEVFSTGIFDMSGLQLEISYDPTIVEVVDANPGVPGIQIAPGSFFPSDIIVHNIVDPSTGKIRYTASLQGQKPGVGGDGPIAVIVFRGLNPGRSPLTFDHIVLSDSQSQAIEHESTNGEIVVEAPPITMDINGQIIIPRRGPNNNDGATVCIDGQCVVTTEDGYYEFREVPITATVVVTHQSYLPSSFALSGPAGEAVTLPDVTLRGGDYNQDGVIDMQDAVLVGLAWGSTPSDPHWDARVDVTDDGVIDIRDMVAVQFNWQMTAPGPWDSIVAADRRAAHPVIQFETEFDPNSNTLVSITPAELTLVEGNSGELEILVNDVDGLYGFTLIVNFDSTIIQVTDANPQEAGIQILQGDFLDSLNQFVVINSVDNEKGTIELSITQQYPATARSGSGILGKIPFQVVGQGRSEITLASVQLVKAAQADPEVLATNTNGITQPNPEVLATDINGGRVLSPFMTYLPLIEQ